MGTFLPEPKQRKSQRKVEKFLEISIKYFLKVIRKALRKTCHKPKGVGELTFQISAYIVDAVKRGSVILRDPSQAQDRTLSTVPVGVAQARNKKSKKLPKMSVASN